MTTSYALQNLDPLTLAGLGCSLFSLWLVRQSPLITN